MTKSRKLTSDEEKIVMELFPEKIGDYTRLHSSFCDEAFETLKETGAKGEDINKMVGDFLHSLTKLYAFREKSGLYLFATPQDEKYNGDYRRTRIFLQRRINGWPYRVSPYEEQFASRFSEGNLPNILCVESPTDKKREKWNHRKLERWDLPYFFDGEFVNKDDEKDDTHHKTILDTNSIINFQGAVGFFTQSIMKELRLISGYDILYEKVKYFIQNELFDKSVNLEDLNTLRNLSEIEATRTIIETFKKEINDLTIQDKGDSEIRNYIKISKCRPFVVNDQGYLVPKKSVFNKIIGDSHLELRFANFLENCDDIISYVKNYFGVHFKIDYKNADGNISDYYPDFVVKKNEKEVFIIETKGREDLDVPLKTQRLKQWCEDLNKAQKKAKYDFIYVDEESFDKYHPSTFEELEKNFREYKI